jgi:hypothetical protein
MSTWFSGPEHERWERLLKSLENPGNIVIFPTEDAERWIYAQLTEIIKEAAGGNVTRLSPQIIALISLVISRGLPRVGDRLGLEELNSMVVRYDEAVADNTRLIALLEDARAMIYELEKASHVQMAGRETTLPRQVLMSRTLSDLMNVLPAFIKYTSDAASGMSNAQEKNEAEQMIGIGKACYEILREDWVVFMKVARDLIDRLKDQEAQLTVLVEANAEAMGLVEAANSTATRREEVVKKAAKAQVDLIKGQLYATTLEREELRKDLAAMGEKHSSEIAKFVKKEATLTTENSRLTGELRGANEGRAVLQSKNEGMKPGHIYDQKVAEAEALAEKNKRQAAEMAEMRETIEKQRAQLDEQVVQRKDEEIASLRKDHSKLFDEVLRSQTCATVLDTENALLKKELQLKDKELQLKDKELQLKDKELQLERQVTNNKFLHGSSH